MLTIPRYRYGARFYDTLSAERFDYRRGRERAVSLLGLRPGDWVLVVGQSARDAHCHGIVTTGVQVDFTAVTARVRSVIGTIKPVDSPDTPRESGAKLARGTARLPDPGAWPSPPERRSGSRMH